MVEHPNKYPPSGEEVEEIPPKKEKTIPVHMWKVDTDGTILRDQGTGEIGLVKKGGKPMWARTGKSEITNMRTLTKILKQDDTHYFLFTEQSIYYIEVQEDASPKISRDEERRSIDGTLHS